MPILINTSSSSSSESTSTSAPSFESVNNNAKQAAAAYFAATRLCRSCHELTDKATISDEEILEIIKHALIHTPTAYDSHYPLQVVAMFGDQHKKLWSVIVEALREILSGESLAQAEANITKGFARGHGTILFFTDTAAVAEAKSSHPSYAHGFDAWAAQSQGNLQGTIWTALCLEGMGASLQQYRTYEGVSGAIRKGWDFPDTWEFSAAMPFGVPIEGWVPMEETFSSARNMLVFQ